MLNPYCNTNTLLNDQFNKSYEVVKTVYDNLSVLISVNNRMTVIPTIAALRAFTSSENNQVIFLADNKNTEYKVDYSDAATLDNGDSVIIGADGKRWKKIEIINVPWTPVLYGTTFAGTAFYTANNGLYSKIGNTIYLKFRIDWDFFTGTGEIRIGGLPFYALSLNGIFRYPLEVSYYNSLNLDSGHTLSGYLQDGTNYIRLLGKSNTTMNNVLNETHISGSGDIYATLQYQI